MTERAIIFVSSLGRCGTTCTIQMLAAGGVPIVGDWPDFEVEEMKTGPMVDESFLGQYTGHAIKRMWPHKTPLPTAMKFITIWLDRDVSEQAKSWEKFIRAAHGPAGAKAPQLVTRLPGDRASAIAAIKHMPLLTLSFEDLLASPLQAVQRIRDFIAPHGFTVDAVAMAAVVHPRSPRCAPDLSAEIEMTVERERRRGRKDLTPTQIARLQFPQLHIARG